MPPWEPENIVGKNECVGRRLFDEAALHGAKDQKPFGQLTIRNFEEVDRQYSIDRLGKQGNPDSQVVRYLKPRAEDHGKSFRRVARFDGWAVLRVKELIEPKKGDKLTIIASPIIGPPPGDNKYHADCERPQGMLSHSMALHLRFLVEQYGKVIDASGKEVFMALSADDLPWWFQKAIRVAIRIYRRTTKTKPVVKVHEI